MTILTPFTALLFLWNVNALPYQSNNGKGRFDQDVDGIDPLIDRLGIESPTEGIGRERSMPIPIGISMSRNNKGIQERIDSKYEGYELIGQGQQCKHVSGSFLEGCSLYVVDPEFHCERDCELFDGCVGYQFEYRSAIDMTAECVLFPSKNTFTKCPEHYKRRSGTGYTLAENADELVGGPLGSLSGGLCYRRINKNKLQIACPASCKTCKAGGSHDGGSPINSNGVCEHFCSNYGYCGNGNAYKTGDDCSGCIASVQTPDSPGCWIRYPSGCPKQKNREKYDSLQNPTIWNHETFMGASESQDKCNARKYPINKWCGVSNIEITYLPATAATTEVAITTPATPSEGLKLVNIEDCTQVGSEQSKKNECGQRNVIKLKEKINELVEWIEA